jgi:exodeoxyribonuclease VII large subunit
LNPLAILSRGYSVTRALPEGRIVKDAAEVKAGDLIGTKLHRGELVSRIEKRLLP